MTLNYIDLTSVLAIDKSQGLTRTTQQHTTSGQTFALTEIQTCPLSTLKVADVQISAVSCTTTGRIDRNSTVYAKAVSLRILMTS